MFPPGILFLFLSVAEEEAAAEAAAVPVAAEVAEDLAIIRVEVVGQAVTIPAVAVAVEVQRSSKIAFWLLKRPGEPGAVTSCAAMAVEQEVMVER